MKNVWSNIKLPEKFIEYSNQGFYIIVNNENTSSIKLDTQEYEVFQRTIQKIKSEGKKVQEDLPKEKEALDFDAEEELLRRLIRANVVTIVQPDGKEANKSVLLTHADAYLGLTDSCNFRCIYCYAECGPERIAEIDKTTLSYEEYGTIIDEVVELGYQRLYLTGGEPLLNPYVFRLARYAKGQGLFCGILTNGSLINEKNIHKFHVFDVVKISIDSSDETINDQTRGKGTYQKIVRALVLLKEHGIKIAINTVMTQANKEVLPDVIRFVGEEIGAIEHTIANHVPCGRGIEDKCGIEFNEIDYYTNVVIQSKIEVYRDRPELVNTTKKAKASKKTHCGMASGDVFINCKGDVYPCRMTYHDEYRLGNVYEIGLKKALSNFDERREKITVDHLEGCKNCDLRYLCGGGCRMLHCGYSGSIEKTSTAVCAILQKSLEYVTLLDYGLYSEK
ncbi:MAG TPA: radical SAM protein [Mobilitalea sp.]|nr:radical SAM protein [Mobilitalea sp.]